MANTSLRKRLYRWYHRIQHRLAPGLCYAQDLFEDELERIVPAGGSWLDVGCGHQLLPPWRLEQERVLMAHAGLVAGIDLDFPALKNHATIKHVCMATASALPFPDCSFDLVTANMVVEHLDEPEIQFAEIRRVLKPGGLFLFHTPNVWGYTTIGARMIPEALKASAISFLEGREEKDVFPAYYRANSRTRITHVSAAAGLEVAGIRLVVSSAQLVMIPPLVIIELLWIRLLMTRLFRGLRTNIIACLKRPIDG